MCIRDRDNKRETIYRPIPVEWLFEDAKEARAHYEVLKGLLLDMKKKTLEFSPCIFPWYGVVLTKGEDVYKRQILDCPLQMFQHQLFQHHGPDKVGRASLAGSISFGRSFTCACPPMN